MIEDRRLLRKMQHGDRDALRQIYERYEPDLVTLAANLLHEPALAEDVVQDVFVAFARSAPKLQLRRTLRAYLATAVVNRARDHYRKKSRSPVSPLEDAAHLPAGSDGPVQLAVRNEQMQRLRATLEDLPHDQREIIMLRLHANMKFKEIARVQNVSVKTAISRYRYGLDKLRSMLNGKVPR